MPGAWWGWWEPDATAMPGAWWGWWERL